MTRQIWVKALTSSCMTLIVLGMVAGFTGLLGSLEPGSGPAFQVTLWVGVSWLVVGAVFGVIAEYLDRRGGHPHG